MARHQSPADTLAELQAQLSRYRDIYNNQRPHRALDRATPAQANAAVPKATPTGESTPVHYRLRYDHVDAWARSASAAAVAFTTSALPTATAASRSSPDDNTVTVIELTTSEVLSSHTIEPDKSCWRNQQRSPGRWPGLSVT